MQIHGSADTFVWGLGIEDTWVPQPHPRTGRALDEYELTQHYRYWREDLERAAATGVRAMRYGVPWHRVHLAPGRFDWSWPDEVFGHMIEGLGIHPIVDLVHYGAPDWVEGNCAGSEYPRHLAEYAGAFADRYRGRIAAYTPINEPVVHATYCGRNSTWPPNLRGERGYLRVLLRLVEAMQASIAAIRAAAPQATIVAVEATELLTAEDAALAEHAQFSLLRHLLPTELLLGRVDDTHPLRTWLIGSGIPADRLDRICADAQRVDVMGVNFYPHLSNATVVRRGDDVTRVARYATAADLQRLLREFWEHLRLPLMITETSDNAGIAQRERWMEASIAAVRMSRESGVPVVGYVWWPMFSHVDWKYRRSTGAVDEYWCHMGLYDLRRENGMLVRDETRLADRFAGFVADSRRSVGELTSVRP
jgi:beta-glucosidase